MSLTPTIIVGTEVPRTRSAEGVPNRGWLYLGLLVTGYIGVYLCRKNFSVAVPLLQEHFGATRAEVGMIASISTLAYASGKFVFGPVIDRLGGRVCYLTALTGVAVFCALGGAAGTLVMVTLLYSGNRLSGSAAWGAMVKQVPGWFSNARLPLAMAVLSLSFVFGGVAATLFAGQIAHWSGNDWRMVMSLPALVLIGLIALSALVLPRDHGSAAGAVASGTPFNRSRDLFRVRQLWIVLGLSFVLYLFRETFNTWTVDFLKTAGGGDLSNRAAAFLSTPFDAAGALGIIALGWLLGKMEGRSRSLLLFVILVGLALSVWLLPMVAASAVGWRTILLLGLIGFLSYGPYSLLAGVLAVEIRGPAHVATVAGLVDGIGYVAGMAAGSGFGRLVDQGGYRLGFHALAVLAVIAAVLSLFLYSSKPGNNPPSS